jgi:hypothetical protein
MLWHNHWPDDALLREYHMIALGRTHRKPSASSTLASFL